MNRARVPTLDIYDYCLHIGLESKKEKAAKKTNLLTVLAGFHRLKDFAKDLDCAIFSRLVGDLSLVDSSVCENCSNVIHVLLTHSSRIGGFTHYELGLDLRFWIMDVIIDFLFCLL